MKKAASILLAFIPFTIIVVQSHELGHMVIAQLLDCRTTLHYGHVSCVGEYLSYSSDLYHEYCEKENIPADKKAILDSLRLDYKRQSLYIALGGPVQTMLTGTIGLLILYCRRKKLNQNPFGIVNWIAVFMALFWSRQAYVFAISIFNSLFIKSSRIFGGDEASISKSLNLPPGTMSIVTGVIGTMICAFVVFKIVPQLHRSYFFIFGIMGSALGYILWFHCLGPILLP